MSNHKEAAINALNTLGFKNETAPGHKGPQLWTWRTEEGRMIKVIVNPQNGRCLVDADTFGANLEESLRALTKGE